MTWRLVVVGPARKPLRKAPGRDGERILSALGEMARNPYAGDLEKMKGFDRKYWRRVGDWRILFNVYPEKRLALRCRLPIGDSATAAAMAAAMRSPPAADGSMGLA